MAATNLSLKGLQKSFGEFQALQPLNVEVPGGEFLTILGSSGSGKTTLLNLLAGFLEADAGRIFVGGKDITNLPVRQRNIGMVFQNYALFPHMNVFENIAYGLRVRRLPPSEIQRRINGALETFQLQGFESRMTGQLSGGQQQRVALARALVIEPDLLLMDEPLGALDRQLRKFVQLEIRRLHLMTARTTIYVTHDQEEALTMSDRIAIMSHGRIEQIGSPDELYRNPATPFVARFLGESNLLPGTVGADGSFTIDGFEARHAPLQAKHLPGPAQLLIRPEHFQFTASGAGRLDGTVEETVYLGELTALRFRISDRQSVWARTQQHSKHRVGDKVGLNWNPDDSRLLPAEPG